ncbi:MAG TPA: Fe-Mn family superoxide dismutase [Vineibacter sp.]|nr:Fe-Mn family superoxide dismutase [Vineibacter sp.]
MTRHAQPLPFKPSRLSNLSPRLIASHYENNYGGAVRRLNAIRAQLAALDKATAPGFALNGLKREELIAANSADLHELYFDGLGGDTAMPAEIEAAIARSFGSTTAWRTEFVAMGKALGGGSGWVLLTVGLADGVLRNVWAADHTHSAALGVPILALDMYEHAYHLDFGANAGAYVDAFMANVAWDKIARRYALAAAAAASVAGSTPGEIDGVPIVDIDAARALLADPAVAVIDARKDDDYAAQHTTLAGARHFAPERLDALAGAVPAGGKALVYCAYGFEIGRAAAQRLRQRGVDAVVLQGGIAAWRADGLPTVPAPKEGEPS